MLTAVQVKAVKEPGRYGDGGGLYLVVRRGGSKAWVQRIVVDGRRRDIGLGGRPKVTLAEARRRAAGNHDAIAGGRNPVAEKRRPKLPTFRAAADACYNAHRPRWRSEKVAKNWKQRLEKHAMPKLGSLPIDRIKRQDVLAVLVPIWGRTPETARTVRSYMRAVFRWAQAMGYRDDNPAGEGIDGALPRLPARRSHFRALPHAEVANALRVIDESTAGLSAKLALRFTDPNRCAIRRDAGRDVERDRPRSQHMDNPGRTHEGAGPSIAYRFQTRLWTFWRKPGRFARMTAAW